MKYKQQLLPHLEKLDQMILTSKEIIDTRSGSPKQASEYLAKARFHLEKINDIIEREADNSGY